MLNNKILKILSDIPRSCLHNEPEIANDLQHLEHLIIDTTFNDHPFDRFIKELDFDTLEWTLLH